MHARLLRIHACLDNKQQCTNNGAVISRQAVLLYFYDSISALY